MLALLFIFSILYTTAIYNFSSFGIPLFYLNFIFYFFILNKTAIDKSSFTLYLITISIFTISLLIVNSIYPSWNNPKSFVSYFMLITNGFLFYIFLNNQTLIHIKLISKKINFFLIIIFIYGIYTLLAKNFNFPLFLEFLRNNNSFSFEQNQIGGWVEYYRTSSVWAEPSFSALPIAISLLINNLILKKHIIITNMLIIVYTIITTSRNVMIVLIAFYLLFFIFNKLSLSKIIFIRIIIIIFTTILGTFLIAYLPYYSGLSDLSVIGRSSSVIVGFRIFLEYPFGTGFNSFVEYRDFFTDSLLYYHPEPIIHNLYVLYLQQIGFLSIFLIFIVFILPILIKKNILTSYFLILSSIIATLGGNIFYFSIFWVGLAFFIVYDNKLYKDSINAVT